MKKLMSIAAIALFVAGSSAFACDTCGCKDKKGEGEKKECTATKEDKQCEGEKAEKKTAHLKMSRSQKIVQNRETIKKFEVLKGSPDSRPDSPVRRKPGNVFPI